MLNDVVAQKLRAFSDERDWDQFHTPENLAKSISIEAAELLECLQWTSNGDPQAIKEELADVLTYCYFLAMKVGLEPDQIVLEKLAITAQKYPVEKSRGSSVKYDQLD